MARIPEEELQRIKSQVKVEDLCRDYGIELKAMGPENLMGLCPFHDDHNPSFGVTPAKNLWNCLAGCGGGDVIQLVMKYEAKSFRHAVETLRQRLGLAPPAAPVMTTRQGTAHAVLADPTGDLADHMLLSPNISSVLTVGDLRAGLAPSKIRGLTKLFDFARRQGHVDRLYHKTHHVVISATAESTH